MTFVGPTVTIVLTCHILQYRLLYMSKELTVRSGSVNKKTVVMGNPLIEAAYQLTNMEQRIISLMVAQIDDKRDEQVYTYEFNSIEFAEILGLATTNTRWDQIRDVLIKLKRRVVLIPPKYTARKGEGIAGWITYAELIHEEGIVQIEADKRIAPFLIQLNNNWTKFQLAEVLTFRGAYTIRIYQWLMQARNLPSQASKSTSGAWYVRLRLSTIRERLKMQDPKTGEITKYPRWPDFRRKVIEPAVVEISAKSSMSVSWDAIKRGKSVTEIMFHCTPCAEMVPNKSHLAPDQPTETERDEEEGRISVLVEMLSKAPKELQVRYELRHAEILAKLKEEKTGLFRKTETLEVMATAATMAEMGEEIEKSVLRD